MSDELIALRIVRDAAVEYLDTFRLLVDTHASESEDEQSRALVNFAHFKRHRLEDAVAASRSAPPLTGTPNE